MSRILNTFESTMTKKNCRVLIGSWLLYCLVISASYSSTMKSHLTVPEMVPAVDSLREVAEGDLPWGRKTYGGNFGEYQPETEWVAYIFSVGSLRRKLWDGIVPVYDLSSAVRTKAQFFFLDLCCNPGVVSVWVVTHKLGSLQIYVEETHLTCGMWMLLGQVKKD